MCMYYSIFIYLAYTSCYLFYLTKQSNSNLRERFWFYEVLYRMNFLTFCYKFGTCDLLITLLNSFILTICIIYRRESLLMKQHTYTYVHELPLCTVSTWSTICTQPHIRIAASALAVTSCFANTLFITVLTPSTSGCTRVRYAFQSAARIKALNTARREQTAATSGCSYLLPTVYPYRRPLRMQYISFTIASSICILHMKFLYHPRVSVMVTIY